MTETIIPINTTKRFEAVDLTKKVKKIIEDSNVKKGICVIYTAHTTASIIINENHDPNINADFLECLSSMIPQGKWKHDRIDNNADAHIKSSIVGPSRTLIISDGRPILGTWQNIMLIDFDGPRRREIIVKIIKG